MLVHIKKIVKKADKGNYALGAFNTFNLEITTGIIKGAIQSRSPIVIQISEKTLHYVGAQTIIQVIKTIIENQSENIPIAIHLDHGRTFSCIIECIKSGFSSVMIDGSNLSFNKNTALTKKVVDYAHRYNVWVQGELGRVVKDSTEIKRLINNPEEFLTDPDQAQEFVKKTKVDTLAVSIGNVHGVYKLKYGAPRIYLNRLREIQKKVDVPLVLHGASKIPVNYIKKAVNLGVRIINIDTEIRAAFKQNLVKSLKNRQEYDPRRILKPCIDAVAKVVENKTLIFGSQNKA